MNNTIFLETYTTPVDYQKSYNIAISLESLISYSVFKFCEPRGLTVKFVCNDKDTENSDLKFVLCDKNLNVCFMNDVPWQVLSCNFPVAICEDTVISGLCGTARHICKYKNTKKLKDEHDEGLLGFRRSCLQAPNEVSVWTKFCEVDIIKTVNDIFNGEQLLEVPKNLIRFENHLNKPVRIHNAYRIARELKKENLDLNSSNIPHLKTSLEKERIPKPRKWKSNNRKILEIDCTTKIEDLNINHQYAEGPFFTLADLILVTSYNVLIQKLGSNYFETLLPLTYKWFVSISNILDIKNILHTLPQNSSIQLKVENIIIPDVDDVSLYKSDPKRHNPKKRLFTKEIDIKNALNVVQNNMELLIVSNKFESKIDWEKIPSGANPFAGHLPNARIEKKAQQLENMVQAVLDVAKDGDLIVDFCSGSGHLGILLAYLLPKCTVICLENKEESVLRAKERVHGMCLQNVFFFQCNLGFFIGKFDVGVALHACGVATDLVLNKCLKVNAKFLLCSCCYGSVRVTESISYPRSVKFNCINLDQYLCIGHAADQTHKDHILTERGAMCMAIIDSDRARLAEEFSYKVTLTRLTPLSCTPKNNLLIGVPS